MKRFLLLLVVFMVGCSSSGPKFDLDDIQSKVNTGMDEVRVTGAIGAPTSISTEGNVRKLRYDGNDGGYLEIQTSQSQVIDISRHQ